MMICELGNKNFIIFQIYRINLFSQIKGVCKLTYWIYVPSFYFVNEPKGNEPKGRYIAVISAES